MHTKNVLPVAVILFDISNDRQRLTKAVNALFSAYTIPEFLHILTHPDAQDVCAHLENSLVKTTLSVKSHDLIHDLQELRYKYGGLTTILIDCDCLFLSNWLGVLWEAHLRFSTDVIGTHANCMAYGFDASPLPVEFWYQESNNKANYPALLLRLSGGIVLPSNIAPLELPFAALQSLAHVSDAGSIGFELLLKAVLLNEKQTCRFIQQDSSLSQCPEVASELWLDIAEAFGFPAFPPWAMTEEPQKKRELAIPPIDAVVAWVDGSDPRHKKKLQNYLKTLPESQRPVIHSTRFSDLGEINLCLQSLFKFAPWIRHIYLVTDEQEPPIVNWLKSSHLASRVSVVDHVTIFKGYEEYLPTFNTRTITPMTSRIPGLAEQFIYLDDDYILLKPMKPTDFFEDGRVVLRGTWRFRGFEYLLNPVKKALRLAPKRRLARAKHSSSHKVAAQLAGFRWRFFYTRHNPHPFLRSTWLQFIETHSERMRLQLTHRLRSIEQFNADSLSAHLNLKRELAIIRNDIPTVMIKPETQSLKKIESSLDHIEKQSKPAFLCVQSLDQTNPESQMKIMSILYRMIGTLSS